MKAQSKIVAIVVTYHPECDPFLRLLNSLGPQVDCIVLVDNSSSESVRMLLDARKRPNEHLISLGANFGIAIAQNKGISWASRQGADYILLLDQDSEPASDMVERLVAAAQEKAAVGVPVAAVGPRYQDTRRQHASPFIKVKGLKIERQPCQFSSSILEVDHLISSGCLIPMVTLEHVGVMRDELFIDYVDIEWGLRAKYKGFQSFGVCSANMRHDIGDEPIKLFGRTFACHSHLRHYYSFRNAIWMYRQKWVPLPWKLTDGGRLILKYCFYTLYSKPHHKHFFMMTLGIWHGLRGKMGARNGSSAEAGFKQSL
jgi:rhamnosyltransferase